MENLSLTALVESISLYLELSSHGSINSEPAIKYYKIGEEILKLVKPVLDAILSSEVAFHEVLSKVFEELRHHVRDLMDSFESWQPLLSKVYFITHMEVLLTQIRSSVLDTFLLLISPDKLLPGELGSAEIKHCADRIILGLPEQASFLLREAVRNQLEGIKPSSQFLAELAESLSLISSQEILIEAVALEKLKEKAKLAQKSNEVDYINQLITLVTCMHERLIMIKQSQSQIPVPIPAHFCCPLSLELMTDPVIVATGQTYERAFIERWLDLGLTACPRTRQALENTNLIPNYTVKQLITSWCELNNVKLLDPLKSVSSHQSSLFLVQADSGTFPGNHIMSSKSHQALGSGVKNATGFIGINSREEGSLSNPQFSYDTSVPRVTGNQQRLDKGRQHLAASEGSSTILEDTTNLDGHPLISPSIIELFNAEHLTLRRNKKTVSALSTPTDMSLSQEAGRDANGSDNPALDQLMDYNSGASRKMKSETAYNLGTNRESEFPPQMTVSRSQNHIISRLPSEGSSPGIFPVSAAEAKPDISGIEIKVKMLVEDLQNGSLESQRQSTAELRLLAKDVDNRIVIANCGAVNVLIGMLNSHDASVQENAVTAILNLSINEKNKAAIASAHAIEPLIHVLKTGSPEARENSAAALYSISVTEDSKVRIGRSGAIAPLVDLLGNGTPRGKKDAVRALLNLSFVHENKVRIVKEGAVKYLVGLMVPDAGIVDKAVAVLANLAKILEGRIEICREGGIPLLVDVVELGSARGKENATSALLHLCTNNSKYCSVVLQEGALPPLVALSQFGTPRAKEKAHALIKHLRDQRRGNAGRSC